MTIIRFDAELSSLLRVPHRGGAVLQPPGRRAAVKDMIEACGVPHTEVGGVVDGDVPVGFSHIPAHGATVSVLAPVPPVDVTRPSLLRPCPFDGVRFVVDVNVGKLASLLRMLGMDTCYRNGIDDAEIAEVAERQSRIVLTKDIALLKRRRIVFGRLVRERLPDAQLGEVVRFFGLTGPFTLFSRCLLCNAPLEAVAKASIIHRLEPKTKKYYHRFTRCPDCDRIYWQGSHHDEMAARLSALGIPVADRPAGPI
ncbi:MAG: Mut7-C RNAse domain-containing protein [Pseudomonadota bacterium]